MWNVYILLKDNYIKNKFALEWFKRFKVIHTAILYWRIPKIDYRVLFILLNEFMKLFVMWPVEFKENYI